MNVVDSSGWLEFFANGPKAGYFKIPIKDEANLLIPTVCLYEVFKITLAQAGEDEALNIAGLMSFGQIVDIDREIALAAAKISMENHLPMADSFIYAIAQENEATLWTLDEHFKGLPGVKYFSKK